MIFDNKKFTVVLWILIFCSISINSCSSYDSGKVVESTNLEYSEFNLPIKNYSIKTFKSEFPYLTLNFENRIMIPTREKIILNSSRSINTSELDDITKKLISSRVLKYSVMNSGYYIKKRAVHESPEKIIVIDMGSDQTFDDTSSNSWKYKFEIIFEYDKITQTISIKSS